MHYVSIFAHSCDNFNAFISVSYLHIALIFIILIHKLVFSECNKNIEIKAVMDYHKEDTVFLSSAIIYGVKEF